MRDAFGLTMEQTSGERSHVVHSHRDGVVGRLLARIWECLGAHRFELLSGSTLGAWVELVVPLLPLVSIGGGAALIASSRR